VARRAQVVAQLTNTGNYGINPIFHADFRAPNRTPETPNSSFDLSQRGEFGWTNLFGILSFIDHIVNDPVDRNELINQIRHVFFKCVQIQWSPPLH
jgi:hypothetical protein